MFDELLSVALLELLSSELDELSGFEELDELLSTELDELSAGLLSLFTCDELLLGWFGVLSVFSLQPEKQEAIKAAATTTAKIRFFICFYSF